MDTTRVSVVIPTLNAEQEIDSLLNILETQSLRPCEILVVDSSSNDNTAAIASSHEFARVQTIDRSDFNHGSTRDYALRQTTGDYVCFLTQDAVPASAGYIENLVAPLNENPEIALVSGRQLPKADARRFEQLVRSFNYPDEPSVRGIGDLPRYGIKTFFASDVCSCYRRDAYLECGGFPKVETNEDMVMAARFIAAGCKIAYAPSACVYHSHNLSPRQQYERNKAVGRFLETHASELMGASEIGEGGRLVKKVSMQLLREARIPEFFAFGVDCAARLLGNRVGRASAKKREKGNSK